MRYLLAAVTILVAFDTLAPPAYADAVSDPELEAPFEGPRPSITGEPVRGREPMPTVYQAPASPEPAPRPGDDARRVVLSLFLSQLVSGVAVPLAFVGCAVRAAVDTNHTGAVITRRCGWTALALGGLLGPTIGALTVSLPRDFQGHPGWLIGGAALGTLAALLPAALTDLHVGWGALLFFTLPITLGLLGYEISGRRARRHGRVLVVRVGPGALDVRF